MKSNYKTIGELVERINCKNRDGKVELLLGVSIEKCFIKSVANIIGTDLTKYKIIKKDEFACSLMQVSRDSKIPIARLEDHEMVIISPAYSIFKVKSTDEILPAFLDMWFKRSEFDREASYIAVGGVRGSMPWSEFARIKVPVPSIEKQIAIVKAYRIVADRIELKKKINEKLQCSRRMLFLEIFGYNYDKNSGLAHNKLNDYCLLICKGITPKYSKNIHEYNEIILNQRCINYSMINCDFSKNHLPKIKNKKWLQIGDILINSTGTGTLGRSAQYWGNESNITVDSHITIIRIREPIYFNFFGELCLLLQSVFENMETGSTAQTDLPRERLKELPVVHPKEKDLVLFNQFATVITENILKNARESEKLQKISEILLSKLSQ